MKRKEFLKNLAYLGTGVTVVGCNPLLFDDMVEPDNVDNLSIFEAQKWFEDTYLQNQSSGETQESTKKYKRKPSWNLAKKPKNEFGEDFGWIWIPIEYLDNNRPGIIQYSEDTKFKLKMKNYYIQPILEGLIIYKEKGVFKTFLGQIAYDPFQIQESNYVINPDNFTGSLIRADWDDKLIDGANYNNGILENNFVNQDYSSEMFPIAENNRIKDCYFYLVEYDTYTVEDGIFTIIGHTNWVTVCDGSGPGDIYVQSSGGSTQGGGSQGGGAYFSPMTGSGHGNWVFPYNLYNGYDPSLVVTANGTDRVNFNNHLENTVWGIGLAANISTWSIDKAVALSKTLGANVSDYFPLALRLGKYIGVFGCVVGTYQLYVGIDDNGFQWDEEGWNSLLLALGITGVVLASGIVSAPVWVPVLIGSMAISVAVYVESSSSLENPDELLAIQNEIQSKFDNFKI